MTNQKLDKDIIICPYLNKLFDIKELDREGRTADWNPCSWYHAEFSKRYIERNHIIEVEIQFAFCAAIKEDIERIIEMEVERGKEKIKSILGLENFVRLDKDHTFPGGYAYFVTLNYELTEEFENTLYAMGQL